MHAFRKGEERGGKGKVRVPDSRVMGGGWVWVAAWLETLHMF